MRRSSVERSRSGRRRYVSWRCRAYREPSTNRHSVSCRRFYALGDKLLGPETPFIDLDVSHSQPTKVSPAGRADRTLIAAQALGNLTRLHVALKAPTIDDLGVEAPVSADAETR